MSQGCNHHVDNQGLCHHCGTPLDEQTWDAFTGHDRAHWVRAAIVVLRTPLLLLSPDGRECATECALRGITAPELLEAAKTRGRNA